MQKGSVALHSHQLFALSTIDKYSLLPSYVMLCYVLSPVLKKTLSLPKLSRLSWSVIIKLFPALVLLTFLKITGLLFGAQCFKGLVLGLKKLRMSFLGWGGAQLMESLPVMLEILGSISRLKNNCKK